MFSPSLYLIEILHQTTTFSWIYFHPVVLYLIEILHQTTTAGPIRCRARSLYLIEILHQTTTKNWSRKKWQRLYLIEILHQTTTHRRVRQREVGLYLIEILHQTTTLDATLRKEERCILSKFYIKPQLSPVLFVCFIVVSYRNSTSNHNIATRKLISWRLYLIEILHQTTTESRCAALQARLYLIEILHQTTTSIIAALSAFLLYLIEILHQTTTCAMRANLPTGCILSKFYIKPQLVRLLEFGVRRCILSKFYIKPQLNLSILQALQVVSYRNSTSNHNAVPELRLKNKLYLIEILHQTTTPLQIIIQLFSLYLIEILHQTTTIRGGMSRAAGCILSKFYIKPQQRIRHKIGHSCCILSKFYIKPQRKECAFYFWCVVSYRNSTSNHNWLEFE